MKVRDFLADTMAMIGVLAQGESLGSSDAATGLRFLNSTSSSFTQAGITGMATYTSINDDMTLADGVELALLYNVVATMSYIYGKEPSKYVTDQAALLKEELVP